MVHLRDCCTGSVRGNGAEKRHHRTRGLLADDLVDRWSIFPKCDSVRVGNFANQSRLHANAIVRENGVRGNLLFEGDFGSAERNGKVGRDVCRNAEFVSRFDYCECPLAPRV